MPELLDRNSRIPKFAPGVDLNTLPTLKLFNHRIGHTHTPALKLFNNRTSGNEQREWGEVGDVKAKKA